VGGVCFIDLGELSGRARNGADYKHESVMRRICSSGHEGVLVQPGLCFIGI
jgi:hypothetical protein